MIQGALAVKSDSRGGNLMAGIIHERVELYLISKGT
jgi:hypothetical protein